MQPITLLGLLSKVNEMSIPWPYGLSSMSIVQSRIVTAARRTWMPSSVAPETETRVERHAVDAVDLDPVLAADDGDVADRHPACADDDPAADDRAPAGRRGPRGA